MKKWGAAYQKLPLVRNIIGVSLNDFIVGDKVEWQAGLMTPHQKSYLTAGELFAAISVVISFPAIAESAIPDR
jgi:hypothetical protein